jgi:hypothetical protein
MKLSDISIRNQPITTHHSLKTPFVALCPFGFAQGRLLWLKLLFLRSYEKTVKRSCNFAFFFDFVTSLMLK